MTYPKMIETISEYRDRWPQVLYEIMKRIEYNAMVNPLCQGRVEKIHGTSSIPMFMIYVWTSYHTANIRTPTNSHRHWKWLASFDKYYQIFLQAMLHGVQLFLQKYPQYKNHLKFIDTAYVSKSHYNPLYTKDGIHFSVNNRHNIVTDMSVQILLNHLCQSS